MAKQLTGQPAARWDRQISGREHRQVRAGWCLSTKQVLLRARLALPPPSAGGPAAPQHRLLVHCRGVLG